METAVRGKAKRIHLNSSDCEGLLQDNRTISSLTQPVYGCDFNLSHCNLLPKPRTRRQKRGLNDSFKQKNIKDYFSSPMEEDITLTGTSNTDYLLEELDDSFWDCSDNSRDNLDAKSASFSMHFLKCKEENPHISEAAGCSSWMKKPRFATDTQAIVNKELLKEEETEMIIDPLPNVYYGLVGESNCKMEGKAYNVQLPEKVLMMIFRYLPAEDLYQNISLVCKSWNAIIHDPLFVPWKKLFFQYCKGKTEAVQEIEQILLDNKITKEEELCVLNFVRYVSTMKQNFRVQPEAVYECLKGHTLFVQAEISLQNIMPELNKDEKEQYVWVVLVVIVLLSDGVRDIQRLVAVLNQPSSTLSLAGISEVLYHIAVLLFAMRKIGVNISNRFHYNLYYVLHLMENTPFSFDVLQQPTEGSNQVKGRDRNGVMPVSEISFTHEQKKILNHDISDGHIVKIMAFAGTGKTFTLIKYAQQRPHLHFLYVAFNKSVAEQAARTFPPNVDCRTIHSMAYQAVGKKYQRLKKLNVFGLKAFSLNWVLPKGRGGFVKAKCVAQTLQNFFASKDDIINTEHVPVRCKNTQGMVEMVLHSEKLKIVEDANGIWEKMKQLQEMRESAFHMPHDGYLKLWQLSRPCLHKYDVIFIDEAQDCTPAIIDIVLSQPCGKILVGDPHQQIYTFRGAINALSEVPHTHIFYLTQSFRFGPEIAYIGATILDVCKNVKKTLVGGFQEGSVQGSTKGKTAILCRCNSTVFDEAVKVTEGTEQVKIHIIGGLKNFGLEKIKDIWALLQSVHCKEEIRDRFIQHFVHHGGFKGLKKYAVEAEDCELEVKIALVEKYNFRIPELVKRIHDCFVGDASFADCILGTVHKAKGLEFDTVKVTNDFSRVPCARHNLARIPRFSVEMTPDDEWNLLYVAVTRARKCLLMTKSIENLITLAGEYFLRSDLTSSLLKDGTLPTCAVTECPNILSEKATLTMKKVPMKYSDRTDEGGPFCSTCVEQRLGPLTFLTCSPQLVKSMSYTLEHIELSPRIEQMLCHF
ncbi:F-box DNA helicase 1 isoform X1 [Erpetoichthys calabaricus]|uniref:DNA 3'-5' helicase n=1 Tax=Erpetoichthys calabaricus TaxID=27687 RepID=A0A8C4SE11_ERPCA|nr:F-box DNA helicase 1 isoform X1 [Erpetoichthys calabaricus]